MAGSSVIGALRVNLGLDTATFSNGLRRAQADMSGFQKSLLGMAAKVSGALAGAFTVRALAGMADQWSDMSSRVGVAVKSMQVAPEIMERISKIANMTYSPLAQTAEGFIANNAVMSELGYTTNQVLDYTEALNNALVVSGAKGERAASVQRALSVAMSTGKLSGDGLNSVLANGGRIAEALARQLGTSRNGLIALGAKGKITADIIGKTLLGEMAALRDEAASMPATIGDGFTLIGNSVTSFVGRMDQATNASGSVAAVLGSVADAITAVSDIVVANADNIVGALKIMAGTAAVVGAAIATKYVATWAVGFVSAARAAISQSIALEMALGAQSRAAAIAGVATKGLSSALAVLRGAIISTGIGAIVVAAGYLVAKFVDLIAATGSFGNAMSLLGDVAAGVWEGIKGSAASIPIALEAVWSDIKASFNSLMDHLMGIWASFLLKLADAAKAAGLDSMASSLTASFNEALLASKGYGEASVEDKADANKKRAEAARVAREGFNQAAEALKKLNIVAEDAEETFGDGGGLGGSIATLGEKGKAKLSDLQKVMKSLREEAEKLAATMGMSDLQAQIWEKQREAGVAANSIQGQQIAGLMTQIDRMKRLKEATEEWRDSVKSAFQSFITQGGSFRNVLGQIIGKLGEMVISRGFDMLWGAGGGGILGSIFGGIPKLFGFSNGTNFAPGGLARINERGGEIVNLPRGSQVIPHDISKRMADRSGQGPSGMRVEVVPSDYFDVRVTQLADQSSAKMGSQINEALPARVQQIQANPRRR